MRTLEISEFKVIVLDFDGVVLDSNEIKRDAFIEIFSKIEGPRQKQVLEFALGNHSVARVEKFTRVARDILRVPEWEKVSAEWVSQFTEITRRKILDCPFVLGAVDFLSWAKKRYPIFVATATPQKEIEWVVQERRLTQYFDQVFGAPQKKAPLLLDLSTRFQVSPKEILFLGDSNEDLFSAQEAGVSFVGIRGNSSFPDASFPVFDHLKGALEFLRS